MTTTVHHATWTTTDDHDISAPFGLCNFMRQPAIPASRDVVHAQRVAASVDSVDAVAGSDTWPNTCLFIPHQLGDEVWVGDGAYRGAGVSVDPVPLMAIPPTVELRDELCAD